MILGAREIMNRNKKIGILLAAVIFAGIPVASSVYSEQVKLVSKGAISYDEDGDGVEETLIDSEDFDRLMGAISEAASSQSAYAGKLEELQKDLEQCRSDTDKANNALIKDKAGLVTALHSKFPGVELMDKLPEDASFEDIIAAVNSLASPSSAKINYGDYRDKIATSSITSGSQTINIAGTTEINLDKNQQLVLPRGYYGSDMTINNVISGKTFNWNPHGKATYIITEPLTSGTFSTENAYKAGYAKGAQEQATNIPYASIEYTYHHHTIDVNKDSKYGTAGSFPDNYKSRVYGGCFTRPVYHFRQKKNKCGHWKFISGDGASQSGCYNTFRCTGCGREERIWSVADSNGSGWGAGDHYYPAYDIDVWTEDGSAYDPSWRVDEDTYYLCNCGKTECQILKAHIRYY
jgi:hypothetical protein